MAPSTRYVISKRDHPGSSQKEIDEPDWGSGHNHRVGFKNRDNRLPGYAHPTRTKETKYPDLRDRKADAKLVNFRDLMGMKEDVHLTRPHDLSLGWRYMLGCTEDLVKYTQDWPINKDRRKDEAKKTEDEKSRKRDEDEQRKKVEEQGRWEKDHPPSAEEKAHFYKPCNMRMTQSSNSRSTLAILSPIRSTIAQTSSLTRPTSSPPIIGYREARTSSALPGNILSTPKHLSHSSSTVGSSPQMSYTTYAITAMCHG